MKLKWSEKDTPSRMMRIAIEIIINDNEDLQWALKTARSTKIAAQKLSFGHMQFFLITGMYINQSSKTISACKIQ